MESRYARETNPLYYIVVLATAVWFVTILVLTFVTDSSVVTYTLVVAFATWPVLPIAMSFDVGIVRQKHSFSIKLAVLLIVAATLPPIAPLAGGLYIYYRTEVVSSAG